VEFKKGIFQAWKVMENNNGHGKSWKDSHFKSLTIKLNVM